MTSCTRCLVGSLTYGWLLMTRDTVAEDTPPALQFHEYSPFFSPRSFYFSMFVVSAL